MRKRIGRDRERGNEKRVESKEKNEYEESKRDTMPTLEDSNMW